MQNRKIIKCKIKDVPIAKPDMFAKMDYASIEDTGRGKTPCLDLLFGRMFLSEPETVMDCCERYSEEYDQMCRAVDEDPAGEFYDVMNWNDLYGMHGLTPSIMGDDYGYPTKQDWRCHGIEWDYGWIDSGPFMERYGAKIFTFAPKEYCKPELCYREVS